MEKNRLEAFSGGVLAIIITIMLLAFVNSWIASGLYVFVALLRLIPDRRIERALAQAGHQA